MENKNFKKVNRPVILGIVGDSATGKTTLSKGIADILGSDRCTVICTDDYHSYDRKERSQNKISALDPKGNYIDILEGHLDLLRKGLPILKPIYNHDGGTLDRPEYIEPKDFVICEGLLGYTTRSMRDAYDVKIYLDPQEELRIKWKVSRDTTKRGYTEEAVMASLEKRKNDSPMFIHPQRTFADIVISFLKDQNALDDSHLDVKHILRPTLPHPDLTPLLDGSTSRNLSLELSRDSDGKPVDVLKINGNLSSQRALSMEHLLWSLLPEASDLKRNHIGEIDGATGISHPLALTQLLIAYHMVKAEHGIHAV